MNKIFLGRILVGGRKEIALNTVIVQLRFHGEKKKNHLKNHLTPNQGSDAAIYSVSRCFIAQVITFHQPKILQYFQLEKLVFISPCRKSVAKCY